MKENLQFIDAGSIKIRASGSYKTCIILVQVIMHYSFANPFSII